MMRFEYNANHKIEKRIAMVAKEITDEYPDISAKDAKKIATLDNPINDYVTNDDKFYRYYLILLTITKTHPAYNKVYIELLKAYNDGLKDEILNGLAEEIINYSTGQRNDFPIISELYE